MSLSPGSKLGPYEILSLLGAGGMGEVYRARDPRLARDVAIKALPADRMADEGRRRRFVQEARAASALNHPNIVTIHEIESADGIDFIVMEYVPGKTLDLVIPAQGMRLQQVLHVAIPMADALARAHAAGIVHRDLKPANVMAIPTRGRRLRWLVAGLAGALALTAEGFLLWRSRWAEIPLPLVVRLTSTPGWETQPNSSQSGAPRRRIMPAVMWVMLFALLAAPPAGPDSLTDLLTRARQLLEAGDREGARRELALARRSYPGSPVVRNFLGVLAAEDGDERAAETLFSEAIQAAPQYTDAFLNLGRLYQQAAGKDEAAASKALAAYQAVLAYEPGNAEALYQCAALRQAGGDFARALADLDLLSPVDRDRPGALAVRCAALVGMGDRAGADAAADRLLARSDLAEADVQMLLPTLAAHGRDDLALRLIEALRARAGVSPDLVLRQARLQEGQDRLDLARKTLEELAVSRSDSVDRLMDLARVAHKQKDYRGALGYLAHARDVEPGNARVHFFFGIVCVDLELGAEAYASLKEAVRLEPDNAAFNYALGAAALHRRDPSEAILVFRRYVQLRPDDPRGGFALGIAAFQAKDFNTARAQLGPAAQRSETRAAASHYLARMAREENDLDEAARLSESAVQANPAYADAWAELGLTRFRRRELAQAEAALGKCLELEPDSYLGNLHLLMLYARSKDPRHDEQERRFEAIRAQREEKAEDFRRVIEVRPY